MPSFMDGGRYSVSPRTRSGEHFTESALLDARDLNTFAVGTFLRAEDYCQLVVEVPRILPSMNEARATSTRAGMRTS
jgi:hypothetical protein